jgi:6-phosphogluconolactonase
VAPRVEKFNTCRLTLTPPVLNNAAAVVLLVSGEDEAETLRAVLEGDYQRDRLPSRVIRPTQGTLLQVVDRAAARRLRIDSSAETAASRPFLASESRGDDGPVLKSE